MTLEEALRKVNVLANMGSEIILKGDREAMRLLIEAGKRISLTRKGLHKYGIPLLPGETED